MSIEFDDVLKGNSSSLAYVRSEIVEYKKKVETFNHECQSLDLKQTEYNEGKQAGYITLCNKLNTLIVNLQKQLDEQGRDD